MKPQALRMGSLDVCYVFEVTTQHMLRDFGEYDSDEPEVSRRWWKRVWADGTGSIVTQISTKLAEIVTHQHEDAEKRLAGEKGLVRKKVITVQRC